MDYEGVIIEESLRNKEVLNSLHILSTKVELVTKEHKTPWLKQWTLHTVKILPEQADEVANNLGKALEPDYWYADFKNNETHYIIFPNKVFVIDRTKAKQYQQATDYGLSLGIPDYQLDFAPNVIYWKRSKK